MAKGGRYLAKGNKEKKKGRGWKIALIVVLVLAVVLGGLTFAANRVLKGVLGKIGRAEVIEREDVSDEDFQYWMTWSPDSADPDEAPETEAQVEEPETAPETTEMVEGTQGE